MFAVVQNLQTSSGGCVFCGNQNPPYLVAGILTPLVGTAEGPKRIRGEMAICIGTEDNPGCLDTSLHEAGGMGPHARRKYEGDVTAQLDQRDRLIERLRGERDQALANQQPVVSLEDARVLLGDRAA